MTATLALGTYRIAQEDLPAAAERAANSLVPWIDTAPHYCGGRAHLLLAPVLRTHPHLRVATKTGFLTAEAARAAVADGVLDAAEAATRHSLSASFVQWQTERSRTELDRAHLDTVFVHNPERTPDQGHLHEQLRDAFAVLEEQAEARRLSSYGIATWTGFTTGQLTVPGLDRIATEAAGTRDHHLSTIQLPVNLVEHTALDQALYGRGPITHATARGWHVHASAPLHGGALTQLDGGADLAHLIRPGATIAEACLTAVASCPGITTVLISTANAEHWETARAMLDKPPVPTDTLRMVLDVLAADD
ncbi:aldo/keto reductase [Streptomyces sp. NPDC020965]|uniref:aldo/keto reductase n=1 Tax=Streptomyces sp. NPDC020965 TaxID=3365105 RepID=UPI0037B97C6F